ncbi:MAG TPA: cell division protein FtsH, partial [Sutterella sp.]|nr:cell division protein FtsH [Sutterella sp.]
TMQQIDAEIRRILEEQYARARKLIEDNRDKMEAMAQALLKWETIDAEQIDDIMAGKPPREPKSSSGAAPAAEKPAASAAPAQEMKAAPEEPAAEPQSGEAAQASAETGAKAEEPSREDNTNSVK